MTELPKAFDPGAVEAALYDDWLQAGLFHAEPDDDGEPYSVVIPPPNVTGSLHVGHALDNTIQDVLVRRARMQGRNAVWMPGTDHAGIATQNVVEEQLAEEGLTRHDLGREAFLQRVWQWRGESGGIILDQLKRLGCSCDWDREAFTFDELRSAAVREVFVRLHEAGLIYRGERLINWCPRCATALSDIEVEHAEVAGELAHFTYPYADGEGGLEVATTRAETMLGDTAIAVHPDDERYAGVVGRSVHHPFFDRRLPVIADDWVDPEFGTGAVKVTPAHDPNDFAMGERHDLDVIDILDDDAAVNDNGGRFAGLDRFEARRQVKDALGELGLLVTVEDHTHQVGHCSRCGTVVEPRLSDQWFVSVDPLAEPAIRAVEAGELEFVPASRRGPFLDWLKNLHDWCISRQIWWGHRIPVWYGPDGEIEVSRTDIDRPGWHQDPDVLDTWFSSQLWPFTVFGWPEQTGPAFETWFPTSVLVTAYDINTFWVSRMVMISLWLHDELPFPVVHNHGLVRDEHGKKMSKSIGNVIDPLELVDAYGADATRFALLKAASPGNDVPLAEEWVDGERRFANKLWNAVRFALQHLEATAPAEGRPAGGLELEDRWILSRLESARRATDAAYDAYDWAAASERLRSFAWSELADWYLEAAKLRLRGPGDDSGAEAARQVLAAVLDDLLRLLHPLMPFVTEELWRALTGAEGGQDSLMAARWPTARTQPDPVAERDFDLLRELVTELRRFRSQHRIAPSRAFEVTVTTDRPELLEANVPLVEGLAGLSGLELADELEDAPGTSRVVFSGGEAEVPLAGLIDVDEELSRLESELVDARDDLSYVEDKLANDDFVTKAPAEVVAGERDRRADLRRRIEELESQLEQLRALRSA